MSINKVFAGMLVAVVAVVASVDAQSYTFTRSLSLGARGADVMNLQRALNMCPDTQVALSGAGSPGRETSTFGPATRAAVIKWQLKANVVPSATSRGAGVFGPTSRAVFAAQGNVCGTNQSNQSNQVPPQTQTGPVTASLSSTTPASGVIVAGQATADLTHITFSGSGVVNSMTLRRGGISDQNTLTNVYLFEGNTRLTDGYSFNTAGEIVMNNLNLMVNGSRTISVRADVSSAPQVVGQTINISLVGVASGASVSTVNISGNLMSIASGQTLATASFGANTVTGTPTINAGSSMYTFWSAPLQVNTRSVMLRSAAFRMIGSAPSDALSNIKLFINGVDTGKTGMVSMIQGSSYVVFDFGSAPMTLPTGSHTVDVRANVDKGSNRTVQLSLQQAADFMVHDPQVGVNIALGGTIPNNAATITINTGSLSVVLDNAFSAMTTVTGGASNVPIARYTLRAFGEDIKINSLQVLPVLGTMTPSAAGLDDVTLYFNGSQIGTSVDWTSGNITFNLGSQLIVPAGADSTLEIRANVRTTGGVNYTAGTVGANLVAGSSNAQGQNSFATISTPAVTGSTLTVQTGLLGVAANPGYSNQSISPNTSQAKIGSFVFQNQSSSESVRVTSLQVALAFSGAQTLANLQSLKTSETSGSGANPIQPQATNTISVDFTLAPGATKTVDILANIGSTSGGTIVATLTTTSIGVSSNVSATSGAITGQTITVQAGALNNPPTFTASASSPAQYVAAAGGATGGSMARYNFMSTNGISTISELKFTASVAGRISSVTVGGVTAPVIGTVAYLTGLNLVVPQGGSGLSVDVLVNYPNVGVNGVASGSPVTLTLTEVKYTSGGTTTVINPSVPANPMTLVGSRPTVALTLPNGATGSSVTGLSVGTKYVADVKVTADAKGDIKVNDLPLTFTGNAAGTTSNGAGVVVKNASGSTITAVTISGTSGQTATATITFTGGYTISAGQTETFRIEVPVTGVSGTGASLATALGAASSFLWTDIAGNASSPVNGSLILNYPTSSVSMTN
jgi:hypothetical protein